MAGSGSGSSPPRLDLVSRIAGRGRWYGASPGEGEQCAAGAVREASCQALWCVSQVTIQECRRLRSREAARLAWWSSFVRLTSSVALYSRSPTAGAATTRDCERNDSHNRPHNVGRNYLLAGLIGAAYALSVVCRSPGC